MRQVPLLWIWDSVEPISGFPAGSTSLWTAVEQGDLLDFLRAARGTKARFLLTSRRDERDWLHDLPARIELPPMPFDECIQMTEELAKKLGRRIGDVEDWRPLLRFTQGNPLTLTVLVGQALREGLRSRDQIASFVSKLQAGEAVFEDEASEERTRSLAASLAYGFENAFTEPERKQLALLHLFQGFVHANTLRAMGHPESEGCLPEMKGLTREAAIALLNRAAGAGLLTALGGGYYSIHPALPWFFRRFFEQYYAEKRIAAARSFAEVMRALGNYYFGEYQNGNRDVIAALAAEEVNLLHARNLARSNGWWHLVIGPMQGLAQLYGHTGRPTEWIDLVEEIIPDFVDPVTGGPLPGREDDWVVVTHHRALIATDAKRWEDADRLLRVHIDWNRQHAAPVLSKAPQAWDREEKNTIRALASAVHERSTNQRQRGSADCVDGYREALSLAEKVPDLHLAAICAYNLACAYLGLEGIRDLALAEQWYRRSEELHPREDRIGRARCFGQLGGVAYSRFGEAREANRSLEECLIYLSKAEQYYKKALEMFPTHAATEQAITHNQLGLIYTDSGQVDIALRHYRESIRYYEAMRDRFEAGRTRINAALVLIKAGRLADAREWAKSALRDYQACQNADQEVITTLKLLELIESGLQASPPPSQAHPPPQHCSVQSPTASPSRSAPRPACPRLRARDPAPADPPAKRSASALGNTAPMPSKPWCNRHPSSPRLRHRSDPPHASGPQNGRLR